MNLRNVTVGILLSLITSSCSLFEESILNYKNSVVIDKQAVKSVTGDTLTYTYRIRYMDGKGKYLIKGIIVPKFEYYLFEVGDTIK